jgi:hypothetical protein
MISNPQMPGCAGTNLINLIYTKLSTFPSSKISQIIHPVFAARRPFRDCGRRAGFIPFQLRFVI